MILLAVTLVLWSGGWVVLGRIRGCRPGNLETPVLANQLSIIIPARDEEHNLPALLRSLAAQSVRPLETIVVNDASTDRTAEIARESGARVVESQPLPEGWRGKAWACHQGVQKAKGDILLILDADTQFEPDGLRRVLAEFHTAGGRVLSVAPHHAVRDFYEQFSAFFNLVMFAASSSFTLFGDRLAPRGLFGPFVLISRAHYQRAGGYESVKGRILETYGFAQQMHKAGVPIRCRGGRGVFTIRMYPHGWRDLVEGWTKGFASGAGQTPLPILLLVIAWMFGLMTAPLGLALAGRALWWLAAYGLCVAQVAWLLRRVGTFHWGTALFYPLPLVFYFVVFARSALRSFGKKTVTWKGRHIHAD
jgi:4,4'-diaponeurosporenoate glycosyltransferase